MMVKTRSTRDNFTYVGLQVNQHQDGIKMLIYQTWRLWKLIRNDCMKVSMLMRNRNIGP